MNSKEPLVTIPLSEYNRLINIRNDIQQRNITVGSQYIIEQDGIPNTFLCHTYDPTGYHFSGYNKNTRINLSIKLKS